MNFTNKFQQQFSFLQPEDFEAFFRITTKLKFRKGERIIERGDTRKKVFVILKGIVRGFIYNYKRRELTTFLHQENEPFMAYEPVVQNKPTNHIFECLEPTEVLSFDYEELITLTEKNANIKKVKDAIITNSLIFALQRNEQFIQESPEKRYLSFIEHHSDLMQRVSQKHIASYLGITAVSFSRVKNRIYMQQDTVSDSQ
ncbi:MAG: Crp/Fnr family transcriptional regulator [Bacteroidota bacterium]